MSQSSVPQTHPPGQGWRDFSLSVLRGSELLFECILMEVWKPGCLETQIVYVWETNRLVAFLNIEGLMWRPATRPKHEPEVAAKSLTETKE